MSRKPVKKAPSVPTEQEVHTLTLNNLRERLTATEMELRQRQEAMLSYQSEIEKAAATIGRLRGELANARRIQRRLETRLIAARNALEGLSHHLHGTSALAAACAHLLAERDPSVTDQDSDGAAR